MTPPANRNTAPAAYNPTMEFALSGLSLPLRIRPERPMTDVELMRFCAKNEALPIERDTNGDILVMSPSGSGTGNKNFELNLELGMWNRRFGEGVAFDSNTGFTLPDGSMRSPDAAWLPTRKWQALSPAEQAGYAALCPEFLIELRSPSDPLSELHRKMEQWIANGAQLAWLIDPIEKTVTLYRPHAAPERLDHPTEVTGEGPVAGFVLPLERIFS